MTQHESALHDLAERLTDTDQGLAGSLAEILTAALQELIETEARRPGRRPNAAQ